MTDLTIFEQDGNVYTVLSHSMPIKELAKETARGIKEMGKIPRAKMKVVTKLEFMKMPFKSPKLI